MIQNSGFWANIRNPLIYQGLYATIILGAWTHFCLVLNQKKGSKKKILLFPNKNHYRFMKSKATTTRSKYLKLKNFIYYMYFSRFNMPTFDTQNKICLQKKFLKIIALSTRIYFLYFDKFFTIHSHYDRHESSKY